MKFVNCFVCIATFNIFILLQNSKADLNSTWKYREGIQLRKNLFSSVIRVTSILEYPYLSFRQDGKNLQGNDRFEGYCKELLDILAQHIGFRYELTLVKDSRFGNVDDSNGNWNGMVGEILRNETDLIVSSMAVTSARAHVIDFSVPFANFQIAVLMKKKMGVVDDKSSSSRFLPGSFDFLKPLKPSLWLLVVSTILGILGYYFLIESVISNPVTVRNKFVEGINFVRRRPGSTNGTEESSSERSQKRSKAGIIIKIAFIIFLIIILSGYVAKYSVRSYKRVHRNNLKKQKSNLEHDFKSLKDLWYHSKSKYTVVMPGTTASYLQFSTNPNLHGVYTQIIGQNTHVKSTLEGIQHLRGETNGENYAFIMEEIGAKYIAAQYCDLQVLPRLYGPKKSFAIGLPQYSDLLNPINDAILHFKETGILEDLESKFRNCKNQVKSQPARRKKTTKQKNSVVNLNLTNMAGLFFLLLGSYFVSIGIACSEFYLKKMKFISYQISKGTSEEQPGPGTSSSIEVGGIGIVESAL